MKQRLVMPQLASQAVAHSIDPVDCLRVIIRFKLANAAEVALAVANVQAVPRHAHTPSRHCSIAVLHHGKLGSICRSR
jgi:hypothetical protein